MHKNPSSEAPVSKAFLVMYLVFQIVSGSQERRHAFSLELDLDIVVQHCTEEDNTSSCSRFNTNIEKLYMPACQLSDTTIF